MNIDNSNFILKPKNDYVFVRHEVVLGAVLGNNMPFGLFQLLEIMLPVGALLVTVLY